MTAEFRDYPALDFRPVGLINSELGNTLWRDIRYVDPHPLRDRRRPVGLMVPSLMGAVRYVRPEQAGAAVGVLTTTQQFAIASGVAVIGAVFYEVIEGRADAGELRVVAGGGRLDRRGAADRGRAADVPAASAHRGVSGRCR
jgi:hypothetical protein